MVPVVPIPRFYARAGAPSTYAEPKVRKDWVRRLLEVVDAGASADSADAMDLAEEHRRMMAGFMGECGYRMHGEVAQLYPTSAGE